jgi:hypothetical protein
MPDWLINLIVQYPVAALNGFVAWYAWKQVREKETDLQHQTAEREKRLEARSDALRKELRSEADSEIQRFISTMKGAHDAHLASKDAEIDRLAKQLLDESKKLAKKVEEMTRKKPD